MLLLADESVWRMVLLVATLVVVIIVLFMLLVMGRYVRLWLQSMASGAGIGIFDLLAMTFRKVDPRVIVRSKIMAVQSGLGEESGITTKALEAHYMAQGHVPLVVRAIIARTKPR